MTITIEKLSCEMVDHEYYLSTDRCSHCGHDLGRDWYNLTQSCQFLATTPTQFRRLQRSSPSLATPSYALGLRSPRWRRADLIAAMEAERYKGSDTTLFFTLTSVRPALPEPSEWS